MTTRAEDSPELNVLVVDDDDDGATLMVQMLRLKGFRATHATGLHNALERCSEQIYDVLLSDLELGDGSGFELAASLKSRAAKSRAAAPLMISVTGSVERATRALCLEAGFDHHFTKPLQWDALLDLLGRQARSCLAVGPEERPSSTA